MWHNTTYRLETTLNYGFERCWTLAVSDNSNKVAIGYDEGTVMVKLGHEMPVASMDKTGKLIVAVNNVVSAAAVRLSGEGDLEDGDRCVIAVARACVGALCVLIVAHLPRRLQHPAVTEGTGKH